MQFFFAYIADGTVAFDPDVHNVKDERVYALSFAHNEGEFATLSLQIRNPRIGLLNDIRKQWVWASYQLDDSLGLVPFFKGRLVALPEDMQKELVTLAYRAEPTGYAATKLALAQTLKVDPYWDDLWIHPDQRNDPDVIIESNPVRYHIDPVTHAVTVSNIIDGEDGTIIINTDEYYSGTLRFGFGTPPLARVDVKAVVGWDQKADGSVDLKSNLLRAFADAGSPDGLITSFTGQGLLAAWPLPGDHIGGGWAFGLSQLGSPMVPTFNTHANDIIADYLARMHSSNYAQVWTAALNQPRIVPEKVDERDGIIVRTIEGDVDSRQLDDAAFYIWKIAPINFEVSYATVRNRTEQLSFSLLADVQEIITDVEAAFTISIQSQQLQELLEDGSTPIGDPRRSSYFDTARGKRSLRYLIALAARVLLQRARTATLTLDVPFSLFSDVSCRRNALVVDPNLPGGQAGGKIVGYGFTLNSNGGIKTTVNIAGTVGKGESLTALDPGTPTCVDEEGLGPDCQEFEGAEIAGIVDQVKFTDYKAVLVDDGVNFFHMKPETVIAGARAKNVLAIKSVPEDGDTIVIGATTYTWRDAVGVTANEVLIGDTTDQCVFNFGSALIGTLAFSGLLFGSATVQNTLVSPTLSEQADVISLYAKLPGTAGNAIAATTSGDFAEWRSALFKGGSVSPGGLTVVNGVELQRDVLSALNPPDNGSDPYMFFDLNGLHSTDFSIYGTIEEAITQLNNYATRVKLEMIPVTGGPFNTDYAIVMSQLMIPKTVDLEAPSIP